MDGEFTQSPQLESQPEVSMSASSEVERHHWPIVWVVIIALVIVAALAWLGDWAMKRDGGELTAAQKEEILRSLVLPLGTPPLTEVEKQEILNSLALPSDTPPLTEVQKAEILKSLGR